MGPAPLWSPLVVGPLCQLRLGPSLVWLRIHNSWLSNTSCFVLRVVLGGSEGGRFHSPPSPPLNQMCACATFPSPFCPLHFAVKRAKLNGGLLCAGSPSYGASKRNVAKRARYSSVQRGGCRWSDALLWVQRHVGCPIEPGPAFYAPRASTRSLFRSPNSERLPQCYCPFFAPFLLSK